MKATHIIKSPKGSKKGTPVYSTLDPEGNNIAFYIGDKVELIRYAKSKKTNSGTAAVVRLPNGTIGWIDSKFIGSSIYDCNPNILLHFPKLPDPYPGYV